jgi:curved DNA-binding protein CbpA
MIKEENIVYQNTQEEASVDTEFERILAIKDVNTRTEAYSILNVDSICSFEEIHARYRVLIKKYHFDRFKNSNYQDRQVEIVSRLITEAYNLIHSTQYNQFKLDSNEANEFIKQYPSEHGRLDSIYHSVLNELGVGHILQWHPYLLFFRNFIDIVGEKVEYYQTSYLFNPAFKKSQLNNTSGFIMDIKWGRLNPDLEGININTFLERVYRILDSKYQLNDKLLAAIENYFNTRYDAEYTKNAINEYNTMGTAQILQSCRYDRERILFFLNQVLNDLILS